MPLNVDPDKAAQLISVDPFPNGSGRHVRLMTDALLRSRGVEPFTGGSRNLVSAGDVRRAYIDALRSADHGDLGSLSGFVRS